MWGSGASGVWPLIASQVYLWVRLSFGRVPQLCQSWFLLTSTSGNSHAIANECRSESEATWCEPPAMSLGALQAPLLFVASG